MSTGMEENLKLPTRHLQLLSFGRGQERIQWIIVRLQSMLQGQVLGIMFQGQVVKTMQDRKRERIPVW